MNNSPIGFFDSGIGGRCVLEAVCKRLPHESTVYIADTVNCPYGPKPAAFIVERAIALTDELLADGCKMIVVACNTATAAAIDILRDRYGDVPFVGMEPAIKPAALNSASGIVGVLATEGTFHGRLYRETSARFAKNVTVLASVADEFVALVEKGETTGSHAEEVVRSKVMPLLDAGADHIVLGCTHFPHLMPVIEKVVNGRAVVIDPAPAVAAQVERVLASREMLSENGSPSHVFKS